MTTEQKQQLTDLDAWFKSRPLWVQHAAACLIGNTTFALSDLVALCKQEAGIPVSPSVTSRTTSIPPHLLGQIPGVTSLHLDQIDGIEGINALAPNRPLVF